MGALTSGADTEGCRPPVPGQERAALVTLECESEEEPVGTQGLPHHSSQHNSQVLGLPVVGAHAAVPVVTNRIPLEQR